MCKLVIDTGALTRNLEKLRHYTSARIIAVVKGGGYGLGLAPYAQWLTAQGVDMLAVSSAAEAAALDVALTPVPGGVGSVTSAVLCKHTVQAAEKTL